MNDTDLHDVLSRASDSQDAPELVHRAVVTANRRRARRRSAVAVAVAAVVVGGVVLVPRIVTPSADPVKEPTSTPTPDATVDLPDTDIASQPVWDPATIATASLRPTRLPEQIDLQAAQGPSIQDQPMSGIVAALQVSNSLRLLDLDGTWRTVPIAAFEGPNFGVDDITRPAISSDGTRVAIATPAGIRVINATTGTEDTIPWPARFAPPWDNPPSVEWQPEDNGFIVLNPVEKWFVGPDGSSQEAPYRSYSLAVDPDGPVYEHDFNARTLIAWDGDQNLSEAPFPTQCERFAAGYGLVACTTGALQSRSGPVVADPTTGEILAYAPIEDPNARFSDNGGLTMLGFIDGDTLVMAVGPATFNGGDIPEERFLVSWQFRTGEFQRIATGNADIRQIAVAPALVDSQDNE